MNTVLRIPQKLMSTIRQDLMRSHVFAAERVGFLSCHCAALTEGGLLLLAQDYNPVADDEYENNPAVGAMIGAAAIRKAMQFAYSKQMSMFHIHMHHHQGTPSFSPVDRKCNNQLVPDFFNVSPHRPHGAVVLSFDSATGHCWRQKSGQPNCITEIITTGSPTAFVWGYV